jgi:hypothetical protein
LYYNELYSSDFLPGRGKPLKTEVFRGSLIAILAIAGYAESAAL